MFTLVVGSDHGVGDKANPQRDKGPSGLPSDVLPLLMLLLPTEAALAVLPHWVSHVRLLIDRPRCHLCDDPNVAASRDNLLSRKANRGGNDCAKSRSS